MNISQIEKREKALRARAEDLKARGRECEAKGYPDWLYNSIQRDFKEWEVERDEIANERYKYAAGQKFATKMGGNPGGQKGFDGAVETKAVTKTVSPLQVPVSEYRGLYEAVKKRLPSYRIDCNNFTNDVNTNAG
jgi:hypothetical protein